MNKPEASQIPPETVENARNDVTVMKAELATGKYDDKPKAYNAIGDAIIAKQEGILGPDFDSRNNIADMGSFMEFATGSSKDNPVNKKITKGDKYPKSVLDRERATEQEAGTVLAMSVDAGDPETPEDVSSTTRDLVEEAVLKMDPETARKVGGIATSEEFDHYMNPDKEKPDTSDDHAYTETSTQSQAEASGFGEDDQIEVKLPELVAK